MLSIRLSRVGKKNYPQFRLIVLDKRKDAFGDYLELLGHYHPISKKIDLKADRIKYWLSVGAQPSVTVHNMLVKQNVISEPAKKIKVNPKNLKKEGAEAPKVEAAPAAPKEEKKPEEKK